MSATQWKNPLPAPNISRAKARSAIAVIFRQEEGRARELTVARAEPTTRATAVPQHLAQFYFHSHTLEIVLPEASTSYSKAPHAPFIRASFCEVVRKNAMPR